jgi:HK97 family phage prohead protease
MTMETRQFKPELREQPDTPAMGAGHFLVFNQETELWKGFREKVDPGALDNVMDDDVRVLVNHDSNLIVARTSKGTAKLSKDETGGVIEWQFPDTTAGRDLLENMRNGNIDGMSFGFTVKDDKLERNKETGEVVRTIMKLERLYDASPVVFPAYQQTDTQLRAEYRTELESRPDWPKEQTESPNDDLAIKQQQKHLKLRISINKNK